MNLDLHSKRARKARFAKAIGGAGAETLAGVGVLLVGLALYCFFIAELPRAGYASLATGLALLMPALWYRLELSHLPPIQPAKQLDDILAPVLLANLKADMSPLDAWRTALHGGPAFFILNHLLLHPGVNEEQISNKPADMAVVWQQTREIQQHYNSVEIHAGTLITALILSSPILTQHLERHKLKAQDVLEVFQWLDRQMSYGHRKRAFFGGIGRDWASGFTPTLDRFGENYSRQVEAAGGYMHYLAHPDALQSVINSLHQSSAVALVGAAGTGKTTLAYGLADHLLQGKDKTLQYYQVVSLNASMIMSAGGEHLEDLLLTLFHEAVHAGNIILCIDEAKLFFGSGVGAFDISQILMPMLRNRNVKVIAAFTPEEWQDLRRRNEALATGFANVVVQEPPLEATMRILEDLTPGLEHHNKLLITYDALRETVRLSGQYMQELAYPGKAISLLNQALPYAQDGLVNATTIQLALEKTRGLRVSAAAAPEADVLLHLEDRIHERMINQVRAVNVIAGALRRGRAGVSNPKRPVGSFLFLGPTGVGKTELARSLAAVYFGDEHQMIRLDMSEYQQAEDVSRLLSAGAQGDHSLLLSIREQPFSVVLLDEIEKAHPNILNLMLQLLDEGQLTDVAGKPASFRSAIIIATSNAGATDIIERVRSGNQLDDFERPLLDKLMAAGTFKPELINRFDEVVLFRPLEEPELLQVAKLMLGEVNRTLSTQNIRVELTPEALAQLAKQGYDPEFGARPMRRLIQKTVENAIAVKILQGEAQPGSVITLDLDDLTPQSVANQPEPTNPQQPQSPAAPQNPQAPQP